MKLNLKLTFRVITSFFGLIFLNFLLISFFSKSASFALWQLLRLKFYIIPLALGFGFQVALFSTAKDSASRLKIKQSGVVVGSTGMTSTGTMIACCAHHITEALPFLAVGGLSIFFTNYQKELLIVSILLNWLGVLYFFSQSRKKYSNAV